MGDVRDPSTDQALPIPNDRRPIVDTVRDDLLKRKEHGVAKYGQALQAFNGRDPVQDAFEESVDLMLYLKQLLEENAALTQYILYTDGVWCDKCDEWIRHGDEVFTTHGVTLAEVVECVRDHEREAHPNG